MNELNPAQVDQMMFDQNQPTDTRKPFRQFVDDKLIPYGGMAAAVPLGAANAVGNILSGAQLTGRQTIIGQ